MVELINITKSYHKTVALQSISLKLQKGDKLALLGLNGAGKSTLIKILSGCFFSDTGQYKIFDTEVTSKTITQLKRHIGYLPENNPLYDFMIVEEYLRFVGRFYGVKKSRLFETMEMTNIQDMRLKTIKTLSKGYRQRVGLAATILHNPEILILDEPSTGLDINQSYNIRQLLKTIMKDKLVIFSSHTIEEIKEVSDSLLVLRKGTHLIQQKAPYNDIIGFIKDKGQATQI